MSTSPRICIVGIGSIGSQHINTLRAMGYTNLVGLDTRPMPYDERLPIVDRVEDLGVKPDYAIICSTPGSHYEHALYFLGRGIPTFIEKPMTVNLLQALELCDVASRRSASLAVGYMERAHPIVQSAYKYARMPQCRNHARRNEVTHGTVECRWMAVRRTYRPDVVAESSHALDTARYVFGKIDRVEVLHRSTTQVIVKLLCDGQVDVVVTMNTNAEPLRRIHIYSKSDVFVVNYGKTTEEWATCYQAELQAFLDGKPLCSGEDGAAVMKAIEVCHA